MATFIILSRISPEAFSDYGSLRRRGYCRVRRSKGNSESSYDHPVLWTFHYRNIDGDTLERIPGVALAGK